MTDAIGGSDDFSFYLLERPGCFFFMGNGRHDRTIHGANYDFNDDLVPKGGYLWLQLVLQKLA